MDAKSMFKSAYGDSYNLITPTIVDYGGVRTKSRKFEIYLVCELSKGFGIVPGTMVYGVTMAIYNATTGRTSRLNSRFSRSFHYWSQVGSHVHKCFELVRRRED